MRRVNRQVAEDAKRRVEKFECYGVGDSKTELDFDVLKIRLKSRIFQPTNFDSKEARKSGGSIPAIPCFLAFLEDSLFVQVLA